MTSRPNRPAPQGFYGADNSNSSDGVTGTLPLGGSGSGNALVVGGGARPTTQSLASTGLPTTTTPYSHQVVFQEAVRNGDACVLQRILEELQNKVDVNSYNTDGQTALHQSCQDGNLELVKLLVQFGADVRLANRDGWSALHIAAWSGHREIAMYLINAYKR